MSRILSNALKKRLHARFSDFAALWFVTIDHPDLAAPIRVVSDFDGMNYERVIGGDTFTWIGFPFLITLLTDGDDPPTARFSIQNVDRQIGQAIQSISTAASLKVDLISSDEFDLTTNPRTELGTTEIAMTATNLLLRNVRVDAITIEADISSWDFRQEPFPWQTATMDVTPGLFVR